MRADARILRVALFTLLLAPMLPIQAGADPAADCPTGFGLLNAVKAEIRSQAKEYWASEARPFVNAIFGRGESAAFLRSEKFKRLPESAKSALTRAYDCAGGAACLAAHGVKLGFAPAYVLWDTATISTKVMMAAPKSSGIKLVAMPASIVYKNAPYVVGYTALTAMGWNIPALLHERSSTYATEIEQVIPRERPFRPDELMVVVNPVGDASFSQATRWFVERAGKQGGLDSSRVVTLTVSDPEDLIRQLGALREKGRIRELVVAAHGAPGKFDFKGGGALDFNPVRLVDSSGELNQKKLEELRPQIEKWAPDLFAEDARINLFSCEVSRGKDGVQFVKSMGGMLLKSGGTIIASPRDVTISPIVRRGGT